MNPNNTPQMKPLDEKQKKQYNAYRASGLTPERALSLTLQDADQQYSPTSDVGVDRILFGRNSLASGVAGGIKEAFVGGRREYNKDVEQFGVDYAKSKAPLTYGAGVGRGVGQVVGSFLETADDLTGEAVSGTAMPIIEDAVNSDVGQYLINKATEFNDRNDGVPAEIVDLTELFAIPALFTQPLKKGTAQGIRDSIISNTRRVVDQGIDSTRRVGRLSDYFKPTSPANPIAEQIDNGFKGIEQVLRRNVDSTTDISGQLSDLKAMLRDGDFEARVLPMLDDFDLSPEDRDLLQTYLKNIDEAVNQDGATDVVEAYLSGALDSIDSAAAGATNIVTRVSDELVDRTMRTYENIRNVPEAIAGRVKQANDRRINRIVSGSPEQASANMLELYKKAIVPGVKKKNKTIATIKQIDESVQRAIPELAQKYEVQDLEDFANAISAEKKSIFSEIERGLKAAGDENRAVNLQTIVDELDKLARSERAEFSPELRRAIDRARANLVVETPDGDIVVKSISPSGAQDLIADLNQALQPQYRGARTNADDAVDFLVVNNLRRMVDDVVDDLGAGSFKDLKDRYADLKRMEDDVVHRAVFEAQKGRGLADITDISSAADIAAGAFSPVFLARAAGGFITKEVTKALMDKNELVRQMFLYGKNLGSGKNKFRGGTVPKTPTKTPDGDNVKQAVDDVLLEAQKGDIVTISGSNNRWQILEQKGVSGDKWLLQEIDGSAQKLVAKNEVSFAEKAETKSYGMNHRPTQTGATADDVTQNASEMGLPNDFYENPQYYSIMSEKTYQESFRALEKIKGKPNATVTIYRAAPKNELNNGDWVTLSKEYAKLEARAEGVPVQSFKVKAKDIQFAGDDINEFGFWPSDGKKIVADNTPADGRFVTSPDSEVMKALGDQKLDVVTDFKTTVKITDGEIDLFGTKLPLNSLESKVLNDPDFRIKVDVKTTASGRKSSKQPIAFYDPATGGVTFVPRKDWPLERTIQTFYHEVGHALDYKGKAGDMIDGRSTRRTYLRHSGWKLPLEERKALARERFGRMMTPTVKAYNLTEDQVTDMFNLREVRTATGRFPVSRKLVGYIRSEEELFAEAYAMYRLNPEKLRELSPRTFEFINEIVNQ